MTYNLKDRIEKIYKNDRNKSCAALVRQLRNDKHIKVTPAEFSRYINGVENPPKSELVLAEADKIVTEWEAVNVRV